jgi:hypothetical protein
LSGGIEQTAREFEEQTAIYWRRWARRLALAVRVAGGGHSLGDHA